MSIDRANLERERIEVFARNNAQEIGKALRKLEEHRKRYRTRWLWELIQNARDAHFPDQRMAIEIAASSAEIRFRHDGRPFTRKEILSLIYHGSTKPEAAEPFLGKFGTGFLSTHLLSPIVEVSGTLDQPGRTPVGFRFVLDRSGAADPDIEKAMEKSYIDFMASADSGSVATAGWTEYSYHLPDSPDPTLLQDLDNQLEAIPYVLTFETHIGSIGVTQPQGGQRFRLRGDESLADGLHLVSVEVSQDGRDAATIQLGVVRREDIAVAVPVAVDRAATRLLPLNSAPRLFTYLPLVSTAGIGIPAVLHSPGFRPTEERDGLYLAPGGGDETEANKHLLLKCVAVIAELAKAGSSLGWENLHGLLRVHPPVEGEAPWLGDVTWYGDLLRQLLEALAGTPLIRNSKGQLVRPSDAIVPVHDGLLDPDVLLRFAVPLYGDALPDADLALSLAQHVARWPDLLDKKHPLIQECLLSTPRLLSEVRKARSVPELGTRLGYTSPKVIQWLNDLIASVPEDHRRTTFDGLLPDQDGVFRRHADLSRDDGIDEALKNALEALGDSLRSTLLHRDIRLMDAAIPRLETEDRVAPRVKEGLKKRTDSPEAATDAAFRAACLSAFAWFANRGRWADLRDSFPVLTLDRDGTQVLQRTNADGPRLLVPPDNWPAAAREFWDAFPPRTVLANDYTQSVSAEAWGRLAEAGVVISDLVWLEQTQLTDELLERLSVDHHAEGEHSVKLDGDRGISVGKLALVRTDELYQSVRKNQERAARFLRFVLEYVAIADASWTRRESIPCDCGKTHSIVPCDWLAWIRRTQWVPRGKHAEYISTETLALLAGRDPGLAALMTQECTQALLELLGVNILEQALLSFDDANRSAMRRKLAELAKIVHDPGQIDALVRDLEVRQQVTTQWQSNQALGKRVEELVKGVLEALKIKVEIHFRGYDLDAYLGGAALPDEDIGQLEVGVTKIEIKATRSDAVSMSDVQARTATDDPNMYWLCVVALDPSESLDSVSLEYVRERARFVPGIGEILSKPRGELGDAVQVARVAGVELQNVDAIRYLVGRAVWEHHGLKVEAFVRRTPSP